MATESAMWHAAVRGGIRRVPRDDDHDLRKRIPVWLGQKRLENRREIRAPGSGYGSVSGPRVDGPNHGDLGAGPVCDVRGLMTKKYQMEICGT